MTITLNTGVTPPVDITSRLDDSFDVVLTQELERDAFERVVEDLRFRVSNLDGYFTGLLRQAPTVDSWMITVSVSSAYGLTVVFRGTIDPASMAFDLRGEWLTCTAFSLNRIFWDRTKTTRVNLTFNTGEQAQAYVPLAYIFDRELGTYRTGPGGEGIFQGALFRTIDITDDLASRPIRFCADAGGDPIIGNNGMYAELDPATTVFDLLTAITIYYNAECAIDPATETLIVRKRMAVNNDRVAAGDPEADLAGNVVETEPCEWLPADDTRYDYLYAPFEITRASQPAYLGQFLGTGTRLGVLAGGRYLNYYLTNVIGGYESAASLPVRIFLNPNERLLGPGLNEIGSYHIRLQIPAGSPATTARRLYRSRPGAEDQVVLIHIFAGNDAVEFEDVEIGEYIDPLPAEGPAATAAWFSYNESAGMWNAPLLDYPYGVNEPAGKVFRVLPKLSFRSSVISDTVLPYDLYDVFSFFGRDNSFDSIAAMFDTLLRTVPRARCTVRGMSYRVGDTVRFRPPGLLPDTSDIFVVRKAAVNLLSEESALELIRLF